MKSYIGQDNDDSKGYAHLSHFRTRHICGSALETTYSNKPSGTKALLLKDGIVSKSALMYVNLKKVTLLTIPSFSVSV